MLIVVLSNVCISIDLVNEARYQAVSIILNENSMSNFWKFNNLANNCSNLLLNEFKHYFI